MYLIQAAVHFKDDDTATPLTMVAMTIEALQGGLENLIGSIVTYPGEFCCLKLVVVSDYAQQDTDTCTCTPTHATSDGKH